MSTQPITREKWSEQEHNLFVEGFERYKRDWKKVSEHVKTKNIVQTKLHAQLYFKHVEQPRVC
jgi:SHAQKYF class myb-like DNA-binding protein